MLMRRKTIMGRRWYDHNWLVWHNWYYAFGGFLFGALFIGTMARIVELLPMCSF